MNKRAFSVKSGLYLIIDPSIEMHLLLQKVESALKGGVSIIQILDNFKPNTCKILIIESVVILAHRFNVPVLINQDVSYANIVDGVHFDEIPEDFDSIRLAISSNSIIGITCSNNLDKIEWAVRHHLDYVSIGAVFPTNSVSDYEIVNKETIGKARTYTDVPIFLAGGISLDNMKLLSDTGLDGIAVISGIMNAEDPEKSATDYKKALIDIKRKRRDLVIH